MAMYACENMVLSTWSPTFLPDKKSESNGSFPPYFSVL